MACLRAAQGKSPLILFLHGFPEFWYSWKDLLTDLGRNHQAVALDMRGYNLSARPELVDAYRVPVIVEDVRGETAQAPSIQPLAPITGHSGNSRVFEVLVELRPPGPYIAAFVASASTTATFCANSGGKP
jgi:pimeloyl-ACP methyl ester carboxylesterase